MSEFKPTISEIQLDIESQGIAIATEIAVLRQKAKTDADYQQILKKTQELKELFGITKSEVSPERAKELLGADFLGVEAIEKTFGIEAIPTEIPPIPFTLEELEKIKDSKDRFLILRSDKIPTSKFTLPNTKQTLEKAPETRWALVTKDFIPDTTDKNYIEQIEETIKYFQNHEFAGRKMPIEYQEAIAEFNAQKEELRPLSISSDTSIWEPVTERLANLKITQLTRPTRDEVLHDLEVYKQVNNEYLLPDKYTWTSSLGSDGSLVFVGYFDADGANVNRNRPDNHDDNLGASSSRSLIYLVVFIQPPNILPISKDNSERCKNLLSLIALISYRAFIKVCKILSLVSIECRIIKRS